MTKYVVVWDNGHSSDTLSGGPFETHAEAEAFGNDWLVEMGAIDDDSDAYSFEVCELRAAGDQPTDEDLAAAEEAAWYEELNRGYAQDRI